MRYRGEAQLDRASGYEPEGCGFDSRRPYPKISDSTNTDGQLARTPVGVDLGLRSSGGQVRILPCASLWWLNPKWSRDRAVTAE